MTPALAALALVSLVSFGSRAPVPAHPQPSSPARAKACVERRPGVRPMHHWLPAASQGRVLPVADA